MPRRKVTKRHKHLVYAREMKKRRGESQEGEETTVGLMHSDNQPASVPITITSSKSKTSPMARSRSPSMSPSDTGSIDLSDLQTQNICQDESFTRSEKKLIICCEAENDSDSEGPSSSCKEGRYVVDAIQMDLLVKSFPCRECMEIGTLSTSLKERRGLAVHLVFTCSSCNGNFDWWSSTSSTKQKSGRQKKVVNTAATFASLSSGMGATSFNLFCENMDLPGMHPKSFQMQAESIYNANDSIRQLIFEKAAQTVRREHAKLNPNVASSDVTLDIAVSYDGSWLTRGHTSKVGIGCVIDILTGLVLDAHVMSTYCQLCDSKAHLKESQPEAYALWEQEHLGSGACSRNCNGTSGMMEVHAMKVLWLRSMRRNIRYVSVISDGDSKSYKALCDLQPYGPDCFIEKEECINHVCKRMGTALRNLVTDASKRKITLGGRGHGRLTQNTIRRLSIYYTHAIRKCRTAAGMKDAVMAALYHGFSTDEKPMHHLCPTGTASWCFYNAALASEAVPGPHAKLVHTPLDEELLAEHLLPVYERLTEPALLKRCERKATQNANESLHNAIWAKCPKHKFYTRRRVEFATLLAVSEFNSGPYQLPDIRKLVGCSTSHHAIRLGSVRINRRAAVSRKEARDKKTNRRKMVREATRRREEELTEAEGGPAYCAGMN